MRPVPRPRDAYPVLSLPIHRTAETLYNSRPIRPYRVQSKLGSRAYMILNCPECSTRYLVDPAALGTNGRTVRCAKCSHSWHEDPPEDMPKRVDILPPLDEPPPIPPGSNLPAIVSRRKRANRIGWMALAAVIILIVAGGVLARHPIVELWPPAARLYALVGLPVTAEQATTELKFRNIASQQIVEGGVPVLVVRGEIENIGGSVRQVPAILIALTNAENQELHHWTFAADSSELAAGATTKFTTRLTSPPEGASNISVRFAGDGQG